MKLAVHKYQQLLDATARAAALKIYPNFFKFAVRRIVSLKSIIEKTETPPKFAVALKRELTFLFMRVTGRKVSISACDAAEFSKIPSQTQIPTNYRVNPQNLKHKKSITNFISANTSIKFRTKSGFSAVQIIETNRPLQPKSETRLSISKFLHKQLFPNLANEKQFMLAAAAIYKLGERRAPRQKEFKKNRPSVRKQRSVS